MKSDITSDLSSDRSRSQTALAAALSSRPLHNLDAAVKPVPAIRHRHLLLNDQNETRRWISGAEPQKSMGRERRILRTDAYDLFRSSDESTDKVHGNVVKVSWSNHDILVVMALRVAKFFDVNVNIEKFARLPQNEIARELHRVIVPRFQGRGHWDNAPIHRVLLSLTRQRPRDLIILLRLAAQQAFRRDHSEITSKDLEDIFSEYSQGRLNDIIVEYKSEMPEIERLIKNMGPTAKRRGYAKKNFQYSNDELMNKLSNIKSNHRLSFANKQPISARSLAEFLYKIDFIRARDEKAEGRITWTHYDQNPNLMSQIVDFGYHWEVHPAYRWALNPKDIAKILDEMDSAMP